MKQSLLKTKIETIIYNHPEITTFGRNRIIDLLGLDYQSRAEVSKALRSLRDEGILTSERYGRHNIYRVTGRIDCLGDAEKAIDGILTAKGYNLVKVERCDHPNCRSTYLVEAKDARGIVVTVGYLDGYTRDLSWQLLVNDVTVYMDEI